MSYFVAPEELPDWHVSPESLGEFLRQDWVIVTEEIPSENYPEEKGLWKIKFGVYNVNCQVYSDGVALHMDGDIFRSTILAFWYRRLVPDNIILYLFNAEGERLFQITEPFDEGLVLNKISGQQF